MEQHELLRRVLEVLEAQGIAYMVVGSVASGVYGEPRMTRDIDIVVELRPNQVAKLCEAFPAPEYYVSDKAAREAVAAGGQFNVIHPASGNKIDFMIAGHDAWGRSQAGRRRRKQIFPDLAGYAAAPEDVIISKLLYYKEGGSEKHLRDIAGMMQISGDEIDAEYIAEWTRQLAVTEEWQAVLDRLRRA